MVNDRAFISRVEEIAAEGPGYEKGHDGSDNLCDCIGLPIGAIRRAGGQWRGLHGSNYAARRELTGKPQKIVGTGDLQPGELVFKAYEPGQGGYDLQARYEPGGEYYNGDLRDYYHVGVVISVYPLQIRHMTSPKPKMDTSIGKWAWHGWCRKITKGGEEQTMGKKIAYGGKLEAPINMRAAASTSSKIIAEIPQGTEVELIEGGGYWNRIQWKSMKGYVKSEFLVDEIPGKDAGEPADQKNATERARAALQEAREAIDRALQLL